MRRLLLALVLGAPLLALADDARKQIAELEWARDPSVASFLADADPGVRRAAARAVGRIAAPGDEVALAQSATLAKALMARLADEKDPAVRRELLLALGQAGTPEAARELVRVRDAEQGSEDALLAANALRLAAQENDRPALVRGLQMRPEIAAESALAIGLLERKLRAAGNATVDTDTRAALLAGLTPERVRSPAGAFTNYPFVYALSALGDPSAEARGVLARILAHYFETDTRAEAARGLARSARKDEAPPDALFEDEANPQIEVEVVHALAKHRRSEAARRRLLELLREHPSFHVRRDAASALAESGGFCDVAEESALEKALEDPYATVRANALLALARRAPAKALAAAHRFLEKDAAARMAAARAFAALVPHAKDEAIQVVKELATKDPDHRVRMAALDALGEHADDAALADTVAALAASLVSHDEDPGIFETAADLLLKKADADAESLLLAGYTRVRDRHEFFEAREMIVTGLAERGAKLGDPGRKLIEQAATDPDASVAAAAAKASATLGGKKPPEIPRARKKLAVAPRDWGGKTPVLVVATNRGSFEVELFPELAPLHVANVVTLAEKHFYDRLTWHRVVSNFVIQGGCPRGDGSGDPGYTIPDELTLEPFSRGTLGMPKTATKDTGGCQLFFTHGRTPHLEGRYTVFGRIRKGFEVIDAIEEGDTIESVKVELVELKRSR